MPADGLGRLRRRCRAASGSTWNNPEPRSPSSRKAGRDRRRHARQRRQSARRRRLLGAAARQSQTTTLAVPPLSAVRRKLSIGDEEGQGPSRVEGEDDFAEGASSMAEISCSLGRAGRRRHGVASPISGRCRALSRHYVRAVERPRREGRVSPVGDIVTISSENSVRRQSRAVAARLPRAGHMAQAIS